ncbi:MAG: AMP-binding protein, partial [Candidatus Binataceae bacterium]
MPVLPRLDSYDAIYRQFRWSVPARYNIGVDVCDRWAERDPGRLAILHVHPDGREDAISYGALRELSNRLANVLRAHGVECGDRVAIMLPQTPEVAAAHVAIYKLGAVALPVAVLFGTDALLYRLQNSGAKALLTNAQGLAKLDDIRAQAPDLCCVLSVDGDRSFADLLARASANFTPVDTAADD